MVVDGDKEGIPVGAKLGALEAGVGTADGVDSVLGKMIPDAA